MIELNRISRTRLETEPYRWAAIDKLFSPEDAAALAATFPRDHFKRLAQYDGQKDFEYEIRCLIRMGELSTSRAGYLSGAWRALANELLSRAYRTAMASMTGIDLSIAPLEVNVFHYPPGGSHGAHPDHRDKIVTHVIYFNESWNDDDGGCLTILRSSDLRDVARTVSPLVGNSAVLVRSDDSWHAVSHVSKNCRLSRRSLTATFYRPGCVSTVWPSWDQVLFHDTPGRLHRLWGRLKERVRA
ncbi:MAG TPA: 2OG-Fe(II) oxygenase [Thermoanaerobaculia bacterium]|jgi:SM-20-related protein|nr:2OG-Fe(II) oxygenase [Thermoanaerobaculia bacterium]